MRVAAIGRAGSGLMLLLLLACRVGAQETTGTVFGTLVDQTGAVLPGVKVVIKSADTGLTREAVTNSVGQYTTSLPIGNYEINFLLRNFQPFTARGIALHVNDRLQVSGKLLAGAVETLTVTAERLVQPTSAVQNLVPANAVHELPFLTRTMVQIVTLVPGVSSDLREETCFCDQGNLNISINGARRSAVNWLLDGASNVNGFNNYTLNTTPSLEAIQEINVITSTYAAEWPRNGGGVVNAVTKSGTARFSGSAYEFFRHDALNANSYFREQSTNPAINSHPPRLRYSNFGYTFGGPALPIRKQLFFFASQEWRRSTRDRWHATAAVPDPAWLTDPSNANYVPPDARDPIAVKLLTLWPAPNVAGTNRYQTTLTNQFDTRQEFVRVDYHLGTAWSLTGRYLHDRVDARGETGVASGPELTPGHRYSAGQLAVVEARRSVGQGLFEATYQLSGDEVARQDLLRTRSDLGISIPELFPENAADLLPNLFVGGLSPFVRSQPSPRQYLNHTVSSTLTWQHRTHTVKIGGQFTLEHVNSNLTHANPTNAMPTQGSFSFNSGGGFTAFQNFLRGNSGGACGDDSCYYHEADVDVVNQFRSNGGETYLQDTWRVHIRLTLDLGVRYMFYAPLTDAGNKLFTFSPAAFDPAQVPTFADDDGDFVIVGTGNPFNGFRIAGQNSPYGRAIYPPDKNNVQPRVGAAWDLTRSGHLIVRAGYGTYFDHTQFGMFAQNVQNDYPFVDPFRTDVYRYNVTLANPTAGSVTPPYAYLTSAPNATSDPFVAPRWQQWNIGVQRRLYSRGFIDVGYIGSRGDHLPRFVDINQPQPQDVVANGGIVNRARPFLGYYSIVMRETTAISRYHGLLLSFRHDDGDSGTASLNYTFSRNRADATYDNSSIDNPQNPLDKDAEYTDAGTDRTHVFTASYVYELPFARGPGRWWRALARSWQIAGITRAESGPAGRIRFNCDYSVSCRPNQVGDPGAGQQSGLRWFDPAAFAPVPAGQYGNAPVTPFRLPGRQQWDISISKNVPLHEATRLQVRVDVINAFNQAQFLDVNTVCTPLSGQTTCGPNTGPAAFGNVTSARPPREVELGVRLHW